MIDIQLGKINGNIVEVQKSLIELDAKLSRMERNNFELINANLCSPASGSSKSNSEE